VNTPFLPGIDDIRAAQERIAGYVRRTPVLRVAALKEPWNVAGPAVLKLELFQVTGSFKPRGTINALRTLPPDIVARGLVTASGGNHGLGVAYAGWVARAPVTVFLPVSTPPAKAGKIERWGARVVYEGPAWDEANAAARAFAERERLTYLHPFAEPAVIAGQGTIGLEILEDVPEVDVVVVAIGGGGLIGGIAAAMAALKPRVRVVGVEPEGAATLYESMRAGRVITLDRIGTAAGTLAARRSAEINLELVRRYVDRIVLVSDDEMRQAARWLWFELSLGTELAGAAAAAALLTGKVPVAPAETVCLVVCGAGTDGFG